jgi:hypothetical protein
MTRWREQWRCDRCGRFVTPGVPGSSWVQVPDSDINAGDERERCAACTRNYGPAKCGPGYVKRLCCGVVPEQVSGNAEKEVSHG